MLFFERILNLKPGPAEKRRAARYAVGPTFPLKAVLNLVGCDEFGEPLESKDGSGWDWSGRLVNFSASGVSMQLPRAVGARRGDPCTLQLSLANYQLRLPCHVANLRPHQDSSLFGLKFDLNDREPPAAYRQLLELVAFGASLKPEASAGATRDASGYLVERFRGDFGSNLTVWRDAQRHSVQWFEFQLAQFCVRGGVGGPGLEYAAGEKPNTRPVAPAQVQELHQLFRWVVPNLARAVPEDVRNSLQRFAA